MYQKEEWVTRVEEVAARFSTGSVFEGRGSKDVPADGFSDYARQLWETIEKDGDLDLPTQRKMLSMVCTHPLTRPAPLDRAQRRHAHLPLTAPSLPARRDYFSRACPCAPRLRGLFC